MPSDFAPVISSLKIFLGNFSRFHSSVIFCYAKNVFNKTKLCSHLTFLRTCLRHNIVPKGMQLKHQPADVNNPGLNKSISSLLSKSSLSLVKIHISSLAEAVKKTDNLIFHCKNQIHTLFSKVISVVIFNRVHDLNSWVHHIASTKKTKKLSSLLPSPPLSSSDTTTANTDPSSSHDNRVTCIPADLQLSSAEKSILSKGLNFVPLTKKANTTLTHVYLEKFFRTVRWTAVLRQTPSSGGLDSSEVLSDEDIETPDAFKVLFSRKQGRLPPRDFKAVEDFISRVNSDYSNLKPKPLSYSNISPEESAALKRLHKRDDIVIKPADKGGSVVVWDREAYIAEGLRQLSNQDHYQSVHTSALKTHSNQISRVIKDEQVNQNLPPTANLLRVSQPRQSIFYMLPKIHKTNSPGRPIVSACACPTEHISTYLDSLFQPLVSALPSFIKDSTDAINQFETLNRDPTFFPSLICTMDVTALYTNIPHGDGLQALRFFLEQRPTPDPPTDTLIRLAELVLTLNTFEFNGNYYQQIKGVAMGTKMGPSYACLFMGRLELRLFQEFQGPKPQFYRRFIDDCITLSSLTERQMAKFINFANSLHPSTKFTYEYSKVSGTFLDILLSLSELVLTLQFPKRHIITSVFYKETDSHSYLSYHSSHSTHIRDNIPFSQLLRLRRLCSDEQDFKSKAKDMVQHFLHCHYPDQVVQAALTRASSIPRDSTLKYTAKTSSERPVIIIPFHPHNIPLKTIVRRHWHLLLDDESTSASFPAPPLVAFKNPANIRNWLVHSRLKSNPSPLVQPGTRPCNLTLCRSCPFLDKELRIQGAKTSFHIKKHFTCTSSNIVYVVRCVSCNMLYVGETLRSLEERVREHIRNINDEDLRYPVARHFCQAGHSLNDFRVQGLWLVKGDCAERKILEHWLMHKIGTITPDGMNVKSM